MESMHDTIQLIKDAKNVCIIPSDNHGESAPNALAFFYTLKELGKNVNLIADSIPEKFRFLVPSLDFISTPKNFIISIPRDIADISQVYYEKSETALKIHLTANKGNLKKEDIAFYYSEPRPDVIIALGIQDFQQQLAHNLDSFGFLLDVPIINLDNNKINKQFGIANLIHDRSLSEITLQIIDALGEKHIPKSAADCILTGLMVHYDHLKSPHAGHEVFQLVADMIKRGAQKDVIIKNLYDRPSAEQIEFLKEVFQNLNIAQNSDVSFALLPDKFQNIAESTISTAVEKIKMIGIENDLLVLWKSHASEENIKGFFYSRNQDLINKIANGSHRQAKPDLVHIFLPERDLAAAKEKLLNIITS